MTLNEAIDRHLEVLLAGEWCRGCLYRVEHAETVPWGDDFVKRPSERTCAIRYVSECPGVVQMSEGV